MDIILLRLGKEGWNFQVQIHSILHEPEKDKVMQAVIDWVLKRV